MKYNMGLELKLVFTIVGSMYQRIKTTILFIFPNIRPGYKKAMKIIYCIKIKIFSVLIMYFLINNLS